MKALITGITGQDGSYLADLLLSKGYDVHGVIRHTSSPAQSRIRHLFENDKVLGHRLFLHSADLDDPTTLRRVFMRVMPDEVYHLAGQSHVGLSFVIPESTCELTAIGTLRILEIIRDMTPRPKFYHASSSEIFGRPVESPQRETTSKEPVTPYGCAKAFATHMVRLYRESFGIFACNGIAYNHESPRRGDKFVTSKICRAAAAIKLGQQSSLELGSLESRRDWGDARDVVRGMWLSLQSHEASDYIFATGQAHSVRELANVAFGTVGLDWQDYVSVDEDLVRPAEPASLVGDSSKAEEMLGWTPLTNFEDLIEEMVSAELGRLSGGI